MDLASPPSRNCCTRRCGVRAARVASELCLARRGRRSAAISGRKTRRDGSARADGGRAIRRLEPRLRVARNRARGNRARRFQRRVRVVAGGSGRRDNLRSGDARQQAAFLPPICRGEIIAALARDGAWRRLRCGAYVMQARRDGDNYVLSGEKTSISFSSSAAAALVLARTGTLEQSARGVSAFYVDLNSPGVSARAFAIWVRAQSAAANSFSTACACPHRLASARKARASST